MSGKSGHFDFITGQTGHFGQELSVGDPSEDDVFVVEDGNISLAGSAKFSGPITGPSIAANMGDFNTLVVSGDAHISGDFYVSGTTYVHEIIDTTVSGTISGYTGIFNTSSGKSGSFTESLTISGVPVATGAGGTVGGLPVVGGDQDNIDFGGTELGDVRNINFQQDGENVMVINEYGDVNIQNDLIVTGNISGGIISGKTGVFTESLKISGVSVLTGNQQASIQWLEDIGNGQLTVKESSIDGINFTNTKWYDTIQAGGDIYYDEGNVGVNNNNPQADLDVSGDIYSERIKIGNVIVYPDDNDNLVFDTE